MWRGFVVGMWTLLGLTQCERPIPAKHEPTTATTPTVSNDASEQAAPRAGVDPRSCVDPRSPDGDQSLRWREALDARVDKLLKTATCAASDKSQATHQVAFFLTFDKQGAQKMLSVRRSTSAACNVADCLQPLLKTLQAPAPPGDNTRYYVAVEVAPGSAPQRVPPSDEAPDEERGRCVDVNVSQGPTTLSGRLPPEVIQSVVRSRFDELRHCYEAGLARNHHLQGRVSVRFIVGRDGKVTEAYVSDNSLPDCEVPRCVANAFASFVFPAPEGGIVTVVYPIMLAPE